MSWSERMGSDTPAIGAIERWLCRITRLERPATSSVGCGGLLGRCSNQKESRSTLLKKGGIPLLPNEENSKM
jgi:hypothetical protein